MTPPVIPLDTTGPHVCNNSELITTMRLDITEIKNEQKHTNIMLQSLMSEIRTQRLESSKCFSEHDDRIRGCETEKANWRDLDKFQTIVDTIQTENDQRKGRDSLTMIGISAAISGIIAFFIRLMTGNN